MGVINEVYKAIGYSKYLKVEVFDQKEIVFCVWEREFPISVNPMKNQIYIDTESSSWKIHKDMLEEILVIMNIIAENMDEIRGWTVSA